KTRDSLRCDILPHNRAVTDVYEVHATVLDSSALLLDRHSGAAHRPLVRAAGRPLLDDEVVAEVLAPRLEAQVGEDAEDAGDRAPDRVLAYVEVAGRVVLEHRVVRVHGHDRLDVVVVPGRVVAVDELLELRPL